MSETVLIAGGSGLVGKALKHSLTLKGHQVRLLGRGEPKTKDEFKWNPTNQTIDEAAFSGVDVIINLAGSNVGEGRWTKKRKSELLNSRILSTRLLVNTCLNLKLPLKKFIQASATGYYGMRNGHHAYEETDSMGNDFLARLTGDWEKECEPITTITKSLLVLRLGVVLTVKGGAFATMLKPVKWFMGVPIGSGKQIIPWIHIDDVVGFIEYSIQRPEIHGVYNLVSPKPVTNKEFMKQIGKTLHKPIWPIHVPSWVLHAAMGEQAGIVTGGADVSSKKIIESGYNFQYTTIKLAVEQLLNTRK